MQDESNQPPEMDTRLQQALSHPKRAEIFDYLAQKRGGTGMGERELADAFGLSISLADYHLKVLHEAELIARVEDREQGKTGGLFIASASL